MMWTSIFGVLFVTQIIIGAPVSFCPKSCSCTESGNYLKANCASSDFLLKPLSAEQIASLTTLVINNGSVIKTNPNLSNLSHLRHLSLATNKIQHITAAHLPKSLEYLDLSWNSIKDPPGDLNLLPNLTEINLSGNPISCDCKSISIRDDLLKRGIIIKKPVTCASPKEHLGKGWFSIKCKEPAVEHILEEMQGDAPYEGSGSDDSPSITENETENNTEKWDAAIEDEFIFVNHSASAKEPATLDTPELEGSGEEDVETTSAVFEEHREISTQATTTEEDDEDYDDNDENVEERYKDESTTSIEIPVVTDAVNLNEHEDRLEACNFNCSTPIPIEVANETDSSPVLGVVEGAKILFEDFFGITDATTTTTTTEPPSSPVVEDEVKSIDRNTLAQGRAINIGDKVPPDTEIIGKEVNEEEKRGSISEAPSKQSNSTFIFLGILLVGIICLAIYAVAKKRSAKRNQRAQPSQPDEKDGTAEEMELLKKPVSQTDKLNGTHEGIPLMNGNHNENQHKNNGEVADPEPKDNNLKPSDEDEYVDLRSHQRDQNTLLTPETKRVTIKASEIPNSTPKTPILVTRHVNSDGSIVTTPNIEQHVQ